MNYELDKVLYSGIVLFALTSCSNLIISQTPEVITSNLEQLKAVTLDQAQVVMGQRVYVPIYAYIYYHNNQDYAMNLSATLSIRNTDLTNPIILTSVRYYDSQGKLIRKYTEKPLQLNPLASTDVFIRADDITGGLGANFILEWVAKQKVSEPVIEAVMISTESAQGISFTSPGRVLGEYSGEN